VRRKFWWPPWAYEARPWTALTIGAVLMLGSLAWSLHNGSWDAVSTFLFGAGCVLCIYGAVILQLRREYRERSKWSRRPPKEAE
jgi:hypothetical protein